MTNLEVTPQTDSYVYSESDFDGHQAAPLLLIGQEADPEVVERQDRLVKNMEQLVRSELGLYVREGVVDFSAKSIVNRIHLREGLNGHSYLARKYKTPNYALVPDIDPEIVDEHCEKMKYGSGIAFGNEVGRAALLMNSVEYGNITVIGEKRKHLEGAMWDQMSGLVGKDARPDASHVYGLQVLGFDRDIRTNDHIGAMRIGMKRYLGTTRYGADVKVRTTAIINMSTATGIDKELIHRFQETARNNGDISQLPEFRNCVHWLIRNKLPEGLVLARNETPYGVEHSA